MDLERERGITIKAKSIRLHYLAAGRPRIPAQSDRYARPRGFFLRSFARAFRLRRRAAGGGRQPGRGGADRRQHLPGRAAQPHHHSGDQQNRLAGRATRGGEGADRKRARHSRRRTRCSISAKSGLGVETVLEAIVARVPPPKGSSDAPLRALIFDSWFDAYRGAVVLVRVMEGRMHAAPEDSAVRRTTKSTKWKAWARSRPSRWCSTSWPPATSASSSPTSSSVADARIGDTVVDADASRPALPGFEAIKPMVFAGLFPVQSARIRRLARRAGQTAAERRRVFLRAGKFRGPGLRLPLRISRPAAHGDRAGAPGARVWHRPDHHRAERALPHHHHRRRRDRGGQPHQVSSARRRWRRSKSRSSPP